MNCPLLRAILLVISRAQTIPILTSQKTNNRSLLREGKAEAKDVKYPAFKNKIHCCTKISNLINALDRYYDTRMTS